MSIESFCPYNCTPPPRKSANLEDFLLICTVFPHFGPLSGRGKIKFCGQELYGHPDFSEYLLRASKNNLAKCKVKITLKDSLGSCAGRHLDVSHGPLGSPEWWWIKELENTSHMRPAFLLSHCS